MPAESPPRPSGSLTADPERFSEPAWDLLLASQDQARRWRHGVMDVEHLLLALLQDRRFAVWIEPLPLDADRLLDQLEDFCAAQPQARDDRLYIGDALEDLLEAADRCRAAWGSRLLDGPHLLLALLEEPRIGASLLASAGLDAETLLRQWRPQEPPPLPRLGPVGRDSDDWIDGQPTSASRPAAVARAAPERLEPPDTRPAGIHGGAAAPSKPQPPGRLAPGVEPPAGLAEGLRLERLDDPEVSALDRFGRDLTAAARAGELDPVVGRDPEIRRLIQVLSRRGKNNPVLIGEPGVGKTAVAELLAQRIVAGDVPEALRGLRLVALDVGALIAARVPAHS